MSTDRHITDKAEINRRLRGYLFDLEHQPYSFVVVIAVNPGEIWRGWTVTPGGLLIEGARTLSICTEGEEVTYFLTNSDSGYQSCIGSVRLSGIDYIQVEN